MTASSRASTDSVDRSTFLTRAAATKLILDAGVPLSPTTLDYMAARGTGPKFRILNGRAVYKRTDVEAWLNRDDRPAGAA